jgi:hypothetical protein
MPDYRGYVLAQMRHVASVVRQTDANDPTETSARGFCPAFCV